MKVWALVVLFAVAYAKHEQYQGWKSYFVRPSNKLQLFALGSMVHKYNLDVVSNAAVGRDGVVLVKPKHNEPFIAELVYHSIAHRIHAEDVKTQLDIDEKLIEKRKIEALGKSNGSALFDNYLELEKIYAYLEDIAEQHPDLVTLVNAGDSFEGTPIKFLKISTTNFEDEDKPIIIIDGGIHGREWISPSTILYAVHKLIEDLTEEDMLNDYNWIILPVVNPDGYNYTFATDRFWSKTRSTDQHLLSTVCPGVDANTNFDFFWNSVGTSNTPCADNYPGSSAFSEKETQVVEKILHEHLARAVLYISMRSYGSLILYPWGNDGSLSIHAFALQSVGVSIANAIYENSVPDFKRYIVGNSVLVTGLETSGSSVDYAHSIGIPLTYNFELPGLGEGTDGFHLDPEYIEQVVKETWAGIVVGARRAGQLFGDQMN